MIKKIRSLVYSLLRWTEKWTKTDMVYLTKGGFWLTTNQFSSILTGFVTAYIFANFFPKESYGIYKYILAITGILATSTLRGMETSIMQSVSRGDEKIIITALTKRIQWGFIGLSTAVLIALYYFINSNTTLGYGFLIAALSIPLLDSFNSYGSYLAGKKLFKYSAIFGVITKFSTAIIIAVSALTSNNIFIILVAYFASNTIFRIIFTKISLSKFKPNQKENDQAITYGKHLSIMGLAGSFANELDKILAFQFIGAAGLAIYSFAIVIPEQIKALLKNLHVIIFPKLSVKNEKEIQDTIRSKTPKLLALVSVITVCYIATAPIIYKTLFPQYPEAIILSQIYSLSIILVGASIPMSASLQALAAKKKLYIFNFSSAIIQIISLLFFGYFYGLIGLILARVFTRFATTLVLLFLIKKL